MYGIKLDLCIKINTKKLWYRSTFSLSLFDMWILPKYFGLYLTSLLGNDLLTIFPLKLFHSECLNILKQIFFCYLLIENKRNGWKNCRHVRRIVTHVVHWKALIKRLARQSSGCQRHENVMTAEFWTHALDLRTFRYMRGCAYVNMYIGIYTYAKCTFKSCSCHALAFFRLT